MNSYGLHRSHVTRKGKVSSHFINRRKDNLVKQAKNLEKEICNKKENIMSIIELRECEKKVLDAILEIIATEGTNEIEKLQTKTKQHIDKKEMKISKKKISSSTVHNSIKNLVNLGFLKRKELHVYGKSKPTIAHELIQEKISSSQIQLLKPTKKQLIKKEKIKSTASKEDFLSLIEQAKAKLEQKKKELTFKQKVFKEMREDIETSEQNIAKLTQAIEKAQDVFQTLKAALE